jgi:Na+/H+ antiporter NhaB
VEPPQTPPQTLEQKQKKVHFADLFLENHPETLNVMTPKLKPTTIIEKVLRLESRNDENVRSVIQAVEQGKNKHPFL